MREGNKKSDSLPWNKEYGYHCFFEIQFLKLILGVEYLQPPVFLSDQKNRFSSVPSPFHKLKLHYADQGYEPKPFE